MGDSEWRAGAPVLGFLTESGMPESRRWDLLPNVTTAFFCADFATSAVLVRGLTLVVDEGLDISRCIERVKVLDTAGVRYDLDEARARLYWRLAHSEMPPRNEWPIAFGFPERISGSMRLDASQASGAPAGKMWVRAELAE